MCQRIYNKNITVIGCYFQSASKYISGSFIDCFCDSDNTTFVFLVTSIVAKNNPLKSQVFFYFFFYFNEMAPSSALVKLDTNTFLYNNRHIMTTSLLNGVYTISMFQLQYHLQCVFWRMCCYNRKIKCFDKVCTSGHCDTDILDVVYNFGYLLATLVFCYFYMD